MRHHRVGLARELERDGLVGDDARGFMDAVERYARSDGPAPGTCTGRERAILDYALRLTRDPASMQRDHVDALRDAGLDDGEILDANQVAAYFAYANRTADGLGLALEPDKPDV